MAAVLEREGEPSPALSFYELPVNNSREAIIENVKANIKRGLPELTQLPACETPLLIVAGGPSVKDYLPTLKAFRPDCHVLAVNGAYKFLRAQGVEPEHFILIDSRRDNVCHVDSPSSDTTHYLASQVHPAVYSALGNHQVTLFHLGTEATLEALKGRGVVSGLSAPIGMASIHAIYLAAALGYRRMFLFGYDFSHKEGETYAFEQALNREDGAIDVTVDGKRFRTTVSLARTAEQFPKAVAPLVASCNLDIRVMSTGLLPAVLRAAYQTPTEETERRKYEQIWEVSAYRRVSPGLESVTDAYEKLKLGPGNSIADFGCGTGRCVKWFQDNELAAVGVDIASNCLEEKVPFVRCALWDARELPSVQYGFSTDVLEHVPTERVDDTLRAIYEACSAGCYLNIDTIPDAFGAVIGKTLHLTVKPSEWWEAKLRALWKHVDAYPGERQAIFVCRK